MKRTCRNIRLLSLLPLLLFASVFVPETGSAMGMGMGGGGPVIVDDLVITPGPMKSPMRIVPTGSGKFLVTDYQGGLVYEIDATTPDQPVALFAVQGHPLAVEFEQRGVDFRVLLNSLSRRNRQVIEQLVLRYPPLSLREVASSSRLSTQAVRQIVESFLALLNASQGSVFIGNDSIGTIEVYRRDGTKANTFTSGGVMQPSDLAYDSGQQTLFVADSLNREVKVFSRRGELVRTFGSAAPLADPKGIAIDANSQRVFVSDYGDVRVGTPASINIFDYEGTLLRRITGNFARPQGLAVDDRNIYVVDAMLGQILVFDRSTYASTGTIGSFGVNPGQLLLPMDLSRDPATGKLFVTNNRMGRVAPFDPPSITPTVFSEPAGNVEPIAPQGMTPPLGDERIKRGLP